MSVAINDNVDNYHFGVGMAQSVVAVAIAELAAPPLWIGEEAAVEAADETLLAPAERS